MLNRYNVHFEFTNDIEVSVIVETESSDSQFVIDEARKKLNENELAIVVDHEKACVVDLLETIR